MDIAWFSTRIIPIGSIRTDYDASQGLIAPLRRLLRSAARPAIRTSFVRVWSTVFAVAISDAGCTGSP